MATGDSGEASAARDRELVFALCHEIGNLLAAGRLEAELLAGAEAGDLDRASGRLSEISARAGSLLALIRPLLDPDPAPPLATDPAALLAGLRRGLDARSDEQVSIAGAAGLPDVTVVAEVLHHLLLTEVFFALEAGGPVRVTAAAAGGRVELVVDRAASGRPPAGGDALRGRPLARAVARVLLGRHGGRFAVDGGGGSERAVFSLPAGAR